MFKVLFFGATAEIVGESTLELDDPNIKDTAELLSEMRRRYPKLTSTNLLVAVNQQYAKSSELINAGDEIAIFTAVSGG